MKWESKLERHMFFSVKLSRLINYSAEQQKSIGSKVDKDSQILSLHARWEPFSSELNRATIFGYDSDWRQCTVDFLEVVNLFEFEFDLKKCLGASEKRRPHPWYQSVLRLFLLRNDYRSPFNLAGLNCWSFQLHKFIFSCPIFGQAPKLSDFLLWSNLISGLKFRPWLFHIIRLI